MLVPGVFNFVFSPSVSYPVLGSVEVGELACHTLVVAEDASMLSFITHESESIVAERLSYTVTSGDAFTDGIVRKVRVRVRVVCIVGSVISNRCHPAHSHY